MAGLDDLARRLRRAGDDVRAHAAIDAARAGGNAFLRELQRNTPVLSGTLRRSEKVDSVTGSGLRAVAVVAPHTVYARFRNYGGDISVKRAKVLGTPEAGFFGKHVFQAGSFYMDVTDHWANSGGLDGPVRHVIDGILRDAGL